MHSKRVTWKLSLSSLLIFLCTIPAHAQGHQSPPAVNGTAAPVAEPDESSERLARDMAKKANLERQAALKNDTEKLLKLATELKEYVDKTNESTLSLEVIRKAEEIEKLAKSVREKMRGTN